jgi:hypothetical protein
MGVCIDHPLVADFAVPRRERDIEPSDLRGRQLFQGLEGFPVLDPLASLARYVHANPSPLSFAAVVHPAQGHVADHDVACLLEAQNAPF